MHVCMADRRPPFYVLERSLLYRVPLLLHACIICMQESVITNDDSLISDIPTNKQAKQHAKQKAKHTNTAKHSIHTYSTTTTTTTHPRYAKKTITNETKRNEKEAKRR
jgi:hypothetical protein